MDNAPLGKKPLNLTGKLRDFAEDIGAIKSKTEIKLEEFVTQDEDLIKLKQKVKLLSSLDCRTNILIIGETGVGKELIAQSLHGNRTGKFIDVNCAGIPDSLLESEFFGCDRGAYTDAISRPGYLEEAAQGTLFLDEIGDMPLLLQCKLLRVIQERKSRRLGGQQPYHVSCRFVAATNRTPEEMFSDRSFRQDLFYRLAGVILKIKPLRDRPNDVVLICRNKGIVDDAEITAILFNLTETNFAGNVRGLLNLIEEYKINKQLEA